MKRLTKGFTLIELLVTVILLGIVATIVIYNTTTMSHKSKEREYEAYVAAVKSAAAGYSAQNSDVFASLYVDKSYMYITTGDLISTGYLDENLTNPWTKERIGKDELIKAVLDTATGALTFDYPAEDSHTEQFLATLDDYVINGEPYDCMTGVGTYKLALSDENGDMITDINTLINEYKFECSYPNSWSDWDDNAWKTKHGNYVLNRNNGGKDYGDKDGKIKYTETPGSYEITYSWYAKSGTRKQETRRVTVLEKFQPGLDVRQVNYDYGSETHNASKPNVTATMFDASPAYGSIKSADTTKVTYNTYSNYYLGGNKYRVLAFRPTLTGADLNNTTYTISKSNAVDGAKYLSQSNGTYHHVSNPDYDTGDVRDDFSRIYIADDGDVEYKITTTTTGHYYKNYKLVTDMSLRLPVELEVPGAKLSADPTGWRTNKTVTIKDSYSPVGIVRYEYRIGTGSPNNSENVTSSLLTKTNPTRYVASAITSRTDGYCPMVERTYRQMYVRAINAEGYYGTWTPVQVDVTNKLSYLKATYPTVRLIWKGIGFRVLSDGGTMTVTPESALTSAGGTTITRHGTWTVHTCDGTFSASYSVQSPTCSGVNSAVSRGESTIAACGYTRVFRKNSWPGYCGFYGYSGVPTSGWLGTITSKVGSSQYWLNEITTGYYTHVSVSHGESTNVANTFFKLASGNSAGYAGGTHPLRTIHYMNTDGIIICSGDGSVSNPYYISLGC